MFLNLVDFYKMAHFEHHSSDRGGVVMHNRLVELAQSQRFNSAALVFLIAYGAYLPCYR